MKLTRACLPDKSSETVRSQGPHVGPFFRHTLGSALRISKVVVRANTAMERTKGRRGRKTERIRATRLQHQQSSVPSHINIKSPHLKSKHAHGTTFLVLKSLGPWNLKTMRLGGDWTPHHIQKYDWIPKGDEFDWRFLSGKQPFYRCWIIFQGKKST